MFVCTANIDRSPTAEALLKGEEGFEVQSAGTWVNARRVISTGLIDWADRVFVMEEHHREAVMRLKPEAEEKTVVLDIPDIYVRDDPELIKILKTRLREHLNIEW